MYWHRLILERQTRKARQRNFSTHPRPARTTIQAWESPTLALVLQSLLSVPRTMLSRNMARITRSWTENQRYQTLMEPLKQMCPHDENRRWDQRHHPILALDTLAWNFHRVLAYFRWWTILRDLRFTGMEIKMETRTVLFMDWLMHRHIHLILVWMDRMILIWWNKTNNSLQDERLSDWIKIRQRRRFTTSKTIVNIEQTLVK